jgi:hypothetical protein
MNETSKAARAWINPTEAEQRAETQIRRPSLRRISGLEKTRVMVSLVGGSFGDWVTAIMR